MAASVVTGASGFVGSHLLRELLAQEQHVVAYARRPLEGVAVEVIDADFEHGRFGDLPSRPSVVYHVAGLAHRIPRTDAEARQFFTVNSEGTRRFLDFLERSKRVPDAFVLVSTVAVYGREDGSDLSEETARAATDPYGRSRAEAEDRVTEWCRQHRVPATVLRLPLVVGANAPGNWGALVRALSRGLYVGIGKGTARRSMVLVSDVARFAVDAAGTDGVFHLTDGEHPDLRSLEEAICRVLGVRAPVRAPLGPARVAARLGDVAQNLLHANLPFSSRTLRKLTATLTFSDQRARTTLGWRPRPVLSAIRENIDLR